MSYNKLEISEMTIDDLKEIQDNLITDFDDFWNSAMLQNELLNENTYYVVAKKINQTAAETAEIVGFAGMKIVLDEADIMNIVTKKESRNCGTATAMLEKLICVAKEKKVEKITLEVNEKNMPAIHLYNKFGFKQIAVRKKYYKGIDDALIMQKILQ